MDPVAVTLRRCHWLSHFKRDRVNPLHGKGLRVSHFLRRHTSHKSFVSNMFGLSHNFPPPTEGGEGGNVTPPPALRCRKGTAREPEGAIGNPGLDAALASLKRTMEAQGPDDYERARQRYRGMRPPVKETQPDLPWQHLVVDLDDPRI